ncbi:MAG TPA: hypothetical protein VHB79_03960 [Polyangiaceae bacterium]|nr:hypothetical protein [Polyangiaceae bacterium]
MKKGGKTASGARMQIIEIDDAIPKPYQDLVESELGSSQMLWTYHAESAYSSGRFARSYGGFSHMAYLADDEQPSVSPLSSLLLPILFIFCEKAKLPYSALLRIRVGLFTCTPGEMSPHNPHVDFSQPHRTAVYYVNDSDGDTVIFNESTAEISIERSAEYANQGGFTVAGTVPPRKGKMIAFDGHFYHASSYPTRSARRIAVTFNFV